MRTEGAQPPPRRPLSIAARLFLIYAASAYAMLVLATAVLYFFLVRDLEQDRLRLIVDKTRRVEWALLNRPNDALLLEHEVRWGGGDISFYARIAEDDGRLLLETPAMARFAPPERFPRPLDSALLASLKSVTRLESSEGGSFNLIAVRARNLLTHKSWVIQVAMDRHDHDTLLAKLRQGALFALLLGTLLSAWVGIVAARRGMKPLHDIAVAAERITASQLDERIDPARWPSELEALAVALNRMLSRLEDAFVRMSQCTAEVAHELRTPIHNLMGEAGVALSARRTPQEYRRVLESSLEEYDRLSRMINEMLFLARAGNPKQQLVRERFDARREVDAVRDFFDALSESRGVTINCQGTGEIEANALLLRRALTNLVSNALRHTPRGGQVVVSVETASAAETLIRVADSGEGITGDELAKIWAARPGASPREGAPEGSGLGLPIVRSIVELHGGSITIDSAPGKGTCVVLRFPGRMPAAEGVGEAAGRARWIELRRKLARATRAHIPGTAEEVSKPVMSAGSPPLQEL